MKTIFTLTAAAAALMAFTTASIAGDAPVTDVVMFQGCEMTRASNGNYLFKTDPGCQFAGIENGSGIGVADAPAEAEADE